MIRVVNWNVHGFVDRRGRFSPEPALRVLERLAPDIVALQEVEDRTWQGEKSLQWLAERGGWRAWAGPTLLRGESQYGNAVLARLPATRVARHDLTVLGSDSEPRGLMDIEFEHRSDHLRLLVTHLGLKRRERRVQIERLLGVLGERAPERVDLLAGDFNEWLPTAGLLKRIDAEFDSRTRAATFPARRPLLALDRIWIRPGNRCIGFSVERLSNGESDHLPAIVDLSTGNPWQHGDRSGLQDVLPT